MISFKKLLEEYKGSCVLHIEQMDGSIVTIMFSAMSEENIQVSVLSQMLPNGTVVDMKGRNLTIEEIQQLNLRLNFEVLKKVFHQDL